MSNDSTDYNIALTLYNMFEGTYTSVCLNEKWFWYMFDGAIWKESPKGCDLRNNINNELYFHILDLINKYCDLARKTELDNEKDMYDKKVISLTKLS